jgi:5S rRNA maturation endonuclease (ribonuclease M5)
MAKLRAQMDDKIEQLKQILPEIPNLVTGLRKEGSTSLCGPCPICGQGDDRFVYKTDSKRCWTRSCGCIPESKPWDTIDFHAWSEKTDIKGLIKKYLPENKQITYDYCDIDGKLIHQTVRSNGKGFKQRRPDGNGGWIWKVKDINQILYNLRAVSEADEVLIVEGEKDTDRLSKLGYAGTTCAGGAKSWKSEYCKSLRGKAVVLIPDNDPPGREHMEKVAKSLKGIATSVKMVDLPDLPEKGDVSDFINKFEDEDEAAESLAMLIENAGPYKTKLQPKFEDAILMTQDFKKLDLPKRANFLSPWLKENSISLISGWRGVGKTFFVLGVLDSITRNSSFGQWECETPVNCLYVDGEMTSEDMDERISYLNLDSDRMKQLYIYSVSYASRLGLPKASLTDETWRYNLKAFMLDNDIRLWVADNIGSLAGGLDENVKKDWDVINQWLLELRFEGIATTLLHHVGKGGEQRGTSAREDNIDISITLKSPHDYSPEDGARFNAHFTKARVATKHLPQITDTEFKLIEKDGNHIWTYGNVKQERKRKIIRMLDEGEKQVDIAAMIGVGRAYISQIKKEAIRDGYLTNKNKLTQSGAYYIGV